MSTVYRAMDLRTAPTSPSRSRLLLGTSVRQRLTREAQIAATISPPASPPSPSVAEFEGTLHVMEYVEGESLSQRLTRRPLPPTRRSSSRRVARAIDAAHAAASSPDQLRTSASPHGDKVLICSIARMEETRPPATASLFLARRLSALERTGAQSDIRSDITLGVVL
jgi:hypothetical protein